MLTGWYLEGRALYVDMCARRCAMRAILCLVALQEGDVVRMLSEAVRVLDAVTCVVVACHPLPLTCMPSAP